MPDDRATDAVTTVLAFNDAINRRDSADLEKLMTETHRFIDAAGASVRGRDECVSAWRGFFDSFPDYRNVFDDIAEVEPGVVAIRGHSDCSFAALDGPAQWRALVIEGRVDEWQVSDPTVGS